MTVIECEQRSPEWYAARLGKLTSSRAADMLATIKSGGEAAARRNLRMQLVLERVTGRRQDSEWTSQAMRDGIEREPDALRVYEALTGQLVTPVGFVQHDTLMAGCSPDGMLNDWEGTVSVKSPLPATHWEYLKTGAVPGEYLKQIYHEFWITDASWCDWVSFHPDFPESLQTKLVRVRRDAQTQLSYADAAVKFLTEVDHDYNALMTLERP